VRIMPDRDTIDAIGQLDQIVGARRSQDDWMSSDLRQILDTVPALVFVAEDVACATMFANAAAEAILRAPKGSNVSKSSPDASVPRSFEVFDMDGVQVPANDLPVQRAARGETVNGIQFELRFIDGVRTWLYGNACPLRNENGSIWGAVGAFADITDRYMAEAALRASEERYRAVVKDQTDLIGRYRPDGTMIFVNEVYAQFFGQPVTSLVGNKWYPQAYPDDIPYVEAQLKTLTPNNPVVVIENRVHSGSGELRWLQFVNRGFFDHEGHLVETQSVGRDITERKLAEPSVPTCLRHFDGCRLVSMAQRQ